MANSTDGVAVIADAALLLLGTVDRSVDASPFPGNLAHLFIADGIPVAMPYVPRVIVSERKHSKWQMS